MSEFDDASGIAFNDIRLVGDQNDRSAGSAEFLEFFIAFLPEERVPHSEDLIDEDDVRIDMCGGSKSQSDKHSVGVSFNGLIDKISDFGKGDDIIHFFMDLFSRKPQDHAVYKDILPTGKLGVEAASKLKHGSDLATNFDFA